MNETKNFPPETELDELPDYTRAWHCPPPPQGALFKVTENHWDWSGDPAKRPVRHVLAWE